MKPQTLIISPEQAGLRADKVLALAYPDFSRTRLQKLFDEETVTVLDEPITKSTLVAAGDELTFPHPDTLFKPLEAIKMSFDVLFEDKYFFAINKAVGVAVHRASVDDTEATIANGVLAYLGDKALKVGGAERPGIVHRLDKETSGVLLIAKTPAAYEKFKALFADREIKKYYLAIVNHAPDLLAGSVINPIGRSPRTPLKMAVMEDGFGKEARTDWERLSIDKEANIGLVRCELFTGRTHQARVHLASIGYPVLGDGSYGYQGTYKGRILLHAEHVQFIHPFTGKPMDIKAPIPADFKKFKVLFQ